MRRRTTTTTPLEIVVRDKREEHAFGRFPSIAPPPSPLRRRANKSAKAQTNLQAGNSFAFLPHHAACGPGQKNMVGLFFASQIVVPLQQYFIFGRQDTTVFGRNKLCCVVRFVYFNFNPAPSYPCIGGFHGNSSARKLDHCTVPGLEIPN